MHPPLIAPGTRPLRGTLPGDAGHFGRVLSTLPSPAWCPSLSGAWHRDKALGWLGRVPPCAGPLVCGSCARDSAPRSMQERSKRGSCPPALQRGAAHHPTPHSPTGTALQCYSCEDQGNNEGCQRVQNQGWAERVGEWPDVPLASLRTALPPKLSLGLPAPRPPAPSPRGPPCPEPSARTSRPQRHPRTPPSPSCAVPGRPTPSPSCALPWTPCPRRCPPDSCRRSKGRGLGLRTGLFILLTTRPPAPLFSRPGTDMGAPFPIHPPPPYPLRMGQRTHPSVPSPITRPFHRSPSAHPLALVPPTLHPLIH